MKGFGIKGRDRWFGRIELAAMLLFLLLALMPFVFILLETIGTFSDSSIPKITSLPRSFWYYIFKVTSNSLVLAGLVIVISLGLGIPAAYVLSRVKLPFRTFWLFVLAVPLASPSLVTAIVIGGCFGRTGILASALKLFGLPMPSPYGLAGLALSQVFHALPYTILLVSAGFLTVPREIEEQSHSLGATRFRTMMRLVLPHIFPHILAAITMTLLFSLGDLGAPLILGGGFKVFSLEIFVNFISNWGDKRIPVLFGLWASLIFFTVLLLVADIDTRIVARGRGGPSCQPDSRSASVFGGTIYIAILAFMLIAPYFQVFGKHFAGMLANSSPAIPEFKPVTSTIILAGIAAPLTIIGAVLIADWIKSRKKHIFLPGLLLSPAIIPGVIFGFGYLEALKILPTTGSTTHWQLLALIIVLSTRAIPFVIIIMQSALNSTIVPFEESALSLGASRAKTFISVTLPQIKPFFAVALVVSVYTTITELSATLVLYPPGWRTMSVFVAYYIEEGLFFKAIGMALIMLLAVELAVLVAGRMLRDKQIDRKAFLAPFSMLNLDVPERKKVPNDRADGGLVRLLRKKIRTMRDGIMTIDRRRDTCREVEELKIELSRMELKLLRMQISPHFFFNTLNTIIHLIESDKDTAIATVGRLSALFRYSLDVSEVTTVPLAKEMEYLKTYLEIEKQRFGEKLQYSIDVPRETLDFPIHPLLLQPIVENAVRYGKDEKGCAYVVIQVRREYGGALLTMPYLVLRVIDYGISRVFPETFDTVSGTGIRNVRKRLKNHYGTDLEFSKNDPQGLVVTMKVGS
jgi:iron(III) transport system permease protein